MLQFQWEKYSKRTWNNNSGTLVKALNFLCESPFGNPWVSLVKNFRIVFFFLFLISKIQLNFFCNFLLVKFILNHLVGG